MSAGPDRLRSFDQSDETQVTPAETALELETEIEQTRAQMSDTLSAIEERLNPQGVADQAKDAVRESSAEVVEQVQGAIHDTGIELAGEARQAIQEARVAAKEAAIELGAQAKEAIRETRIAAKETAAELVTQARAAVREATIGKVEHAADSANETARGAGTTMIETIKRNPLPAALATVGLGWLWLKRPKSGSAGQVVYSSYGQVGYPSYERQPARQDAGGAEEGMLGQAQDMVGDAASGTKDMAGQMVGQVQDTVSGAASQVQDSAGQVAGQAQGAVKDLATSTQYQVMRVQELVQNALQTNPLVVGAVALAVGAAVGLAIPETQEERQLMGGMRDTVVDKAQATAQDTMQKVQDVAQKATDSGQEEEG